MAVRALTRRDRSRPGGTFRETVAAGVESDPVKIDLTPGNKVSVRLIAGSNAGKIQYTLSPDSMVADGSAEWTDWQAGDVTGTRTSVFVSAITGLRCVAITEITWEIVV